MKKASLLVLGVLASLSFSAAAKAEMAGNGECRRTGDRGGQQVYELYADFNRGYPSIGTDRGGHDFRTGRVICDGHEVSIQTLSVNPGVVTIAIYNDDHGRRDDRDRRGRRRGGDWGRGGGCNVDASMHWETTHFYCR